MKAEETRTIKIRLEVSAQVSINMMALLLAIVCFHLILGCGPSACPSNETAEHIAKQFIFKEYSDDMYKIDLEIKRIFMKKIGKEEYCVFEFNYHATLKDYFLRYEDLERQRYKKGLQIAYLLRDEGWYGTVIQKSQQ